MIEKREKTIKGKVFSKKDIGLFWFVIEEEYLKYKSENTDSYLKLSIICDDRTSYESEDDLLLKENGILDLKKAIRISISYTNYKNKKFIEFDLSEGKPAQCDFTVRGSDANWVAGVFSKLETTLNSITPQTNFFIEHSAKITVLNTILISFLYLEVFVLTTSSISAYHLIQTMLTKEPLFIWLPLLLLALASGFFFASFLTSRTLNLWHSIEFDFGPEHAKVEKNKRKKIFLFLTIILLPLIFTVVTLFM